MKLSACVNPGPIHLCSVRTNFLVRYRSILLTVLSNQDTRHIANSSVTVVIRYTSIPADLGHKKAITFHTGNCLVRKTAGFWIGALLTDSAATCTQTKRIRIECTDIHHTVLHIVNRVNFTAVEENNITGFAGFCCFTYLDFRNPIQDIHHLRSLVPMGKPAFVIPF